MWLCFSTTVFSANLNDRLKDVYTPSHDSDQNPYASDVEADDLFNTNASITIGQWGGLGTSDSVLVRATRFMMRLWIVLAVPILIYCAIRIMLALWDEWKLQEALKHVWTVLWGVLLILLSVMIIYLITSLTRSSLDIFNQ